MKFGKRIQGIAQENERFGAYFVDYKGLKKFLKRIPRPGSAEGGSDAEEAQDAEERFMLALESEVAKVESFFRSTLAEMLCEFRSLCKRVNKVQLETKVADDFDGLNQLVALLDGTKEAELLQEFMAFSKEVDSLRRFVMTNAQATVKITKKHDKVSEGIRLREHYVSVLHRCTFYNSRDFGALIADIEVLATQLIEKLTGKQPSPDDFQCPICMHVLRNPLVLSCGHRFCNSCISVATYFKQLTCPVCRKESVMDFQNLRVESLLSRFVRNFHDQKHHVCGESKTGADGATPCVLEKPCEQCAQWRCLHSGEHQCRVSAAAPGQQSSLVRLAANNAARRNNEREEAAGRGCEGGKGGKASQLSIVKPHYYSDTHHRPWTACAEIFRTSSRNLMRAGSSGSGIFPILSPGSDTGSSGGERKDFDSSWSRLRDLRRDERRRVLWLVAAAVLLALVLGYGTGLLTSNALSSADSASPGGYANASLFLLSEPWAHLDCPAGDGGASSMTRKETARSEESSGSGPGDKSGVEKLQQARTKSLHKALDNLVKRSSKK